MRIVILAVEPSADLHGAALLKSIKAIDPTITFEGMGGKLLREAGMDIWEDVTSKSEMGVTSFSSLRRWLKRIKTTQKRLLDNPPDAVISVDGPDFNLRAVKGLKGKCKTIEYVAPTAWAWREKRKFMVGERYDHAMVIWPFEEKFFSGLGCDVTWVGVPALDHLQTNLSKQCAPEVPEGGRAICLLPGSRPREIKLNLDLFIDSAKELMKEFDNLYFILPRVSGLDIELFDKAKELGDRLLMQEGDALACMQKSEIAMAVNGTVTQEAMFLSLPHVMTYGITPLQRFLYKPLMKTKYFNMVNVLKDREVVPELLEERRSVENMVIECRRLLTNDSSSEQRKVFEELQEELGGPGVSDRAAKVVMEVVSG